MSILEGMWVGENGMAQTESDADRMERISPVGPIPAELAEMGKKRIEELANAQTELFNTLQETNRRWLDRLQSEAKLASEFASKMTNARSIPDALAACQEWTSRRFEMMADDSKHLLANSQKVMETSTRLLSNGWVQIGRGGVGT